MSSFKAIILMASWSGVVLYALYSFDMLNNHSNAGIALFTATILLIMHMFNMIIYFHVAGNKPYIWFK